MTSRPAPIRANQMDPRPPPIDISAANNGLTDQQMDAELRRAFRLTDQQCALPGPDLASCYSNEFIPIKSINMLLLRLTQFQSSLFSRIAQTPIQSRTTQRERPLYHQFLERCKRRKRVVDMTRRSSDQVVTCEQTQNKQGDHLSDLHWPDHSNLGVVVVLLIEFVSFLRGAFVMFMLMRTTSRSIRLCVSKNLDTISDLVYTLRPMPLERVLIELNQTGANQSSALDSGQCLGSLVEFIGQRYESFKFWNSSNGMQQYGDFVDEFLFLEQSKSLQMFREESILFMYIIISLIIGCGLTGSVVTYYMPYDVFPLLFLYDPTFCAFHIKMRLLQHLNDARQSYLNYWSIFRLNSDLSLSTRGESQQPSSSYWSPSSGATLTSGNSAGLMRSRVSTHLTSGQRASFIVYPRNVALQSLARAAPAPKSGDGGGGGQMSLVQAKSSAHRAIKFGSRQMARRMQRVIEQVPCLSNELYKDFIPDIRSQAARRLIMLLSPTLSAWATFWLNISLVLTFFIFTSFNSSTVDLNRELMLFFERSPEWNVAAAAVVQSNPKASLNVSCLNEGRSLELVRTSMANYLAEQLSRLSSRAEARQFQDRDQRLQRVAKSLAPTTNPDLHEWTIPEGVSVLAATLIILYLNIFFICIGELLFWLFALRIKLNVSNLLLRYYSDTYYLDQLGHSGDRGRHTRHQQTISAELRERLIDVSLMGFDRLGEHTEVPDSVQNVTNESTPTCMMNLGFYQVFKWIFASGKRRELMCYHYAKKLILADIEAANANRGVSAKQKPADPGRKVPSSRDSSDGSFEPPSSRPSDAFLMSAYLEFRLFLEQIDACRQSINVITTYWTIHSLNILASSMFTRQMRSKLGFLLVGYMLVNMGLVTASIFQSQCTKMIPPIHSMLASSLRSNKAIWHLAVLWQRSLIDLLGPRSKFFFTVVSIRISYASALQFNFGLTSLYLLTVDRFKIFQPS